jgi:aspartyl protease family protein
VSNSEGPWRHPDPPPRRPNWRLRLALLIAIIGLAVLGAWELTRLLPGRVDTAEDWAFLVRGVAVLALVASSVLTVREINLGRTARHVALWVGVVVLLVASYVYRVRLEDVARRVETALLPGYAAPLGGHEMSLAQAEDGAYYVNGRVNGQPVIFLVDTGASDIVLSPADAQRLGVDVNALRFDDPYETANGVGRGARYTAASLTVGDLRLSQVAMSINQAPMRTSLLGMTFFHRLEWFQFKDGQLLLRWRG